MGRSTQYQMAKFGAAKRPRLVAYSEDMRRMCALLSDELLHWPGVSVRPMFGMRAFYRVRSYSQCFQTSGRSKVLPRSHTNCPRADKGAKPEMAAFELENERGVANALACLDKAYRRAGSTRK